MSTDGDEAPSSSSFTHTLVEDVSACVQLLEKTDTQVWRRALIRAVFAAIEGLHWQLRANVLTHAERFAGVTGHEMAALMDESYSVNDRGEVLVQPKFLPLVTAIRLAVRIVQRSRPGYVVDFGHRGWAGLRRSVEVRNRIVHPKTKADLHISDREVVEAQAAFGWFLALVIEILRGDVDQYEARLR